MTSHDRETKPVEEPSRRAEPGLGNKESGQIEPMKSADLTPDPGPPQDDDE